MVIYWWNGLIGHHSGWIGIVHEWTGIATQYSNGLVSSKAKNACTGHLDGLVGVVEANGVVLLEWIDRSSQWIDRNCEDGIIGHQNKVSGIAAQYSNGLLGENGQNACIGHFNHVVALVKGYGDLLVEWIDRSS